MYKFALCLKTSGEVINTCLSTCIQEAIIYFALTKKINSFSLLDIYDVKKIK